MLHHSQHRPSREKRKLGKPKQKQAPKIFLHHQLYGDIPLVNILWEDEKGVSHVLRDYDLNYKPKLPPGAVAGDVRKQRFCRLCHAPRYFYIDQQRTCVQCREKFIFSAKEQKYWYEILHFYFDSVAIRCPDCRKSRREETALRERLASAKLALRHNPNDITQLLDFIQATVFYRLKVKQGNLESAIAAARRAIKMSPEKAEPVFWEAVCHALAGRPAKAKNLLSENSNKALRKRKNIEILKTILSGLPE